MKKTIFIRILLLFLISAMLFSCDEYDKQDEYAEDLSTVEGMYYSVVKKLNMDGRTMAVIEKPQQLPPYASVIPMPKTHKVTDEEKAESVLKTLQDKKLSFKKVQEDDDLNLSSKSIVIAVNDIEENLTLEISVNAKGTVCFRMYSTGSTPSKYTHIAWQKIDYEEFKTFCLEQTDKL